MRSRLFDVLRWHGRSPLALTGIRNTPCRIWGHQTMCGRGMNTQAPAMTKVEKLIVDTIKATGPISYSRYMQMCLAHPTEGYYSNPSHAVFGAKGDFITSPEISQVFGELIAVWFLSQWLKLRIRKNIRLIELGPGRGTLMADILRVLSQFPAARAAVQNIQLVENSTTMQQLQQEKLAPFVTANNWNLTWTDSLDDIEPDNELYTMLVAHEFFDALPFHLLEKTIDGWREVLITSDPDPAAKTILRGTTSPLVADQKEENIVAISSPRLRPVLSDSASASATLLGSSSPRFEYLPIGSRLEVSPVAFKIARRIGQILHLPEAGGDDSQGCALIADYGGDKSYGSSFRAFKDHKIVDVFDRPGECDLTANVDFAYLKDAIADLAATHGPIPQASFLTKMGLKLRVDALKKAAKNEERRTEIERAAKRLIDSTGMGMQYQFLAVFGTGQVEPTAEQGWPFVKD